MRSHKSPESCGSWGKIEGGPGGATNTNRGPTPTLVLARKGLAMNATQNPRLELSRDRADQIGFTVGRLESVLAKIDFTGDCWTWTASKKANGYGQFNDSGRNWNVHRLVFQLAGGVIPDGYHVDHLCFNRACVRPDHLEAVPLKVNVRRQADRITHCPVGHPYNSDNTYMWRGYRHCRPCRIQRSADRRAKLRRNGVPVGTIGINIEELP